MDVNRNAVDVRVVKRCQHVTHPQIANSEPFRLHILRANGQEVKGVELIAYTLTVEDEAAFVELGVFNDGLRNRRGIAQTIDTCDGFAVLFENEPASIVFLLHPILGIGEDVIEPIFLQRVEQLRLKAGVLGWR